MIQVGSAWTGWIRAREALAHRFQQQRHALRWTRVREALTLRSLSARSFTTTVCSLVLMQVVSFGLVQYAEERQTRERMLSFMGADVSLVYEIISRTPTQERPQWIGWLNRGFYHISLGKADEDWLQDPVPAGQLPALDVVAQRVSNQLRRPDVHWAWHGPDPILILPFDNGEALLIWAEDPLPRPSLLSQTTYLLVLLTCASLVAWFVLRLAMIPLKRFFAAARALGHDIQAPPVREEGPIEVRQVARVVNRMQAHIRRQMDERTQIVSSLSHDLQTPITRLRLRADLISDEDLRRKFAEDLDGVAKMIKEGLDYARSAQVRENRVPVDLTALVESIAHQMSDLGHQVSVEGRIERSYPAALYALERSLQNLVINAVKFGGSAQIVLEQTDAEARIRVRDPGPGVPPELLERLFEPFYRVETSRNRNSGGTGLGLSIARNLVRAHGGEIVLANRTGGGFEATVILPWRQRED